jgi:hypothetical protein
LISLNIFDFVTSNYFIGTSDLRATASSHTLFSSLRFYIALTPDAVIRTMIDYRDAFQRSRLMLRFIENYNSLRGQQSRHFAPLRLPSYIYGLLTALLSIAGLRHTD